MIDQPTENILIVGQAMERKPSADVAEYVALCNTRRQIVRLRSYCNGNNIATDYTPQNYKGRTYYALETHPVVRMKKKRMRVLQEKFAKRKDCMVENQRQDPRTAHWFERVG